MTERTGQDRTGQGMEGILHELSIGGGWVEGERVHMARLESVLQKKYGFRSWQRVRPRASACLQVHRFLRVGVFEIALA